MTLHEKIAQARLLAERASPAPWEDHNWDVMEKPHVVVPKLWDGHSSCNGSFDLPCTPGNAAFIAQSRTLLPALAEALAIAVSALEHECCCIGDEGPADVCSACLAVREIGKKMGVEG